MLIVSNHVSWVDIVAIGSLAPVAFVAKSEVAQAGRWSACTAKLQRTVFVDRRRRQQTAARSTRSSRGLNERRPVVLFAEGTSSDGNRVLPFRSALLGAVERRRSGRRARHPHPADVDLLHRAARHPDGPPAPPAGRLVRRPRLHAAHQNLDRDGRRSMWW